MEIAIPLLALGGMYIISNQNSSSTSGTSSSLRESYDQKVKRSSSSNQNESLSREHGPLRENFETAGANTRALPNVEIPPQNYPVFNKKELVDTVREYPNPNTATDKYFNQNFYERKENMGMKVGNEPQEIYSLNGNYLKSEQFKHNNMVPFYGAKMKGYTYDSATAETILDNMTGSGSQIIKKIEQAPLFKPEDNIQWAYGAPNQSDFYQSRVNPGMRNNNVKPFETVNVGPGLGKGFSNQGSGGFNSGMEDRDAWLPKTVDQLRVETNPKLVYSLDGHQGPAENYIKNVGIIGRVEKQRPDTFFMNTQDRWLTTTGAEKGETLRPIQELGMIRSPDCASNYMGPAGQNDRQAGYIQSHVEPTKRVQWRGKDVNHSSAVGRGPIDDGERNLNSYNNHNNNRSSVKQVDTMRSGFSGAVGAVIAPIMDIFRATRKEEVSQNVRIYGDAAGPVPSSYVINPNDITPTTVKETTLYSPEFNINNQKEGMYVNNYTPMDLTQRDTTSCPVVGSVGGVASQSGNMVYDSVYLQTNNDIKSSTIVNRPNQGGTQIFNQQMNVSIGRSDTSTMDNRWFTPNLVSAMPPSVENHGKITVPQYYNECAGCDRIEPSILNAFRANPYTHSLTDCV